MDEQLLTGRFSVELGSTPRGQSAPTSRTTGSATPGQDRETDRPRSVSVTSSRADKCLRRTKSSFDIELFRSRLRLHKTLSRSRFQAELPDFDAAAIHLPSFAAEDPDDDCFPRSKTASRKAFERHLASPKQGPGSREGKDAVITGDSDDFALPNSRTKRGASGRHKKAKEKRRFIERNFTKCEDVPDGIQDDLDIVYRANVPQCPGKRPLPTSVIAEMNRISLGKDRKDSAIVRYPPRASQARYRRQSLKKGIGGPTRLPSANSSSGCESSPARNGPEEEKELYRRIENAQCRDNSRTRDESNRESASRTRKLGDRKICFVDETQSDTGSEHEGEESADSTDRAEELTQHNTDFGHVTYEQACTRLGILPRPKVTHQLFLTRMQLTHCGLNAAEAKALGLGLQHNSRLEEIDLSCNRMTGDSIAYIMDSLQRNIYVTKLNLCSNIVDDKGARALEEFLSTNNWVTHLNLSDCSIGDFEIGFILNGLQVNTSVICLNLSKNRIDIRGGRQLGTAIGINNTVVCLNLSWNMIRGGGAVAVCNSLSRNSGITEINLAWNGLAWEGSLSLSEALRSNRTLKKLDITNNRISWDCIPYIARAMSLNKTLEVLEIGHNPLSMDGCLKLLEALDKPSSRVCFLSLAEIPIDAKIAFKAAEIAKKRKFSMVHGGVITTRDIFGIQKTKREDPVSLLVRYLSTMGIRVVDLFRVFDTNSRLYVSEANFIRGLKRVRVPLDSEDMIRVARRMQSNKNGEISYQELAASVRSHIRDERREDLRQQRLENKKREKRRRILQSDLPLLAPSSLTFFPALYNMYSTSRITSSRVGTSPLSPSRSRLSTRDSPRILSKSPSQRLLPRIATPGVRLAATPGVRLAATPGVRLAATPGVRLAATPGVQLAATPGVRLAATPGVRLAATPGLRLAATPGVQLAATPGVRLAASLGTPGDVVAEGLADRKTLVSGLPSLHGATPNKASEASSFLHVVRERSARGLRGEVSGSSLREASGYKEPRQM